MFNNTLPLAKVLQDFECFIKWFDYSSLQVWGNSARFDLGILENAYSKFNVNIPWNHWNERDVRTLVAFAPEIKKNMVFEGVKHNPIDDCKHQIKYCCEIFKKLNYV